MSLKISIGSRRPLRLAGVALLLIGAAMLTNAPSLAFKDAPAGWLTLAVAALLLTFRNYIEVDKDRDRVAQRIGCGYAFALRGHPLTSIRKLTLTSEVTGSGKRSSTLYGLRVNGKSGDWLFERKDQHNSRLVAERLSRALKVDLETRLFGASSTRPADELDMPLAERWRRAGLFKEAPRTDAPTQLTVRHDAQGSELVMPRERGPRLIPALVGLGMLMLVALVFMLDDAPRVMLTLFASVVVYQVALVILRSSGDDVLRFTERFVDIRFGLMPRRRMALAEIEELLESDSELVLLGDEHSLRIPHPELVADRAVLRQFVERQIAQRQLPQK